MANSVYDSKNIRSIEDKVIYITPLKIFYLRQFMDKFSTIESLKSEDDKLELLVECAAIAMQQYCPEFASKELVEDNFDMNAIYDIISIAGGITFNSDKEQKENTKKVRDREDSGWDKLDLVNLESRAFLIGIWKDFHELETSLSMPELIAILEAKNEVDHNDKKFFAAIQGVDLDKGSDRQDEWTAMKERVFGKPKVDPNDVTSLTGKRAQEAGFGIGMGLNYERIG